MYFKFTVLIELFQEIFIIKATFHTHKMIWAARMLQRGLKIEEKSSVLYYSV